MSTETPTTCPDCGCSLEAPGERLLHDLFAAGFDLSGDPA